MGIGDLARFKSSSSFMVQRLLNSFFVTVVPKRVYIQGDNLKCTGYMLPLQNDLYVVIKFTKEKPCLYQC